jgi:hypothetical protein
MQLRSTPPTFITGTASWGGVFPDAALQSACTRFGFNVRPNPGANRARVRLGGVGDDDTACNSPDSWVGVGGFVDSACSALGSAMSAGNVSGCDGAPTPRRAPSFVRIWVR